MSRTILTCFRQNLRDKNKEVLTKSTGVIPAKYPPNVKSENFHNSRVLELRVIVRTLVYEGFGVFIVAYG